MMDKKELLEAVPFLGVKTDHVYIAAMRLHHPDVITSGLDTSMVNMFNEIESLRIAEEAEVAFA